ncbi:hypothetical protein HK100_009667 [Physocladia obscura]|uniref:Alpha-ketoglutarate-dependent dioxygenase AlkB-like domain-containing protein n=1 Tax=Physocladia obscura TaxID=109957 RepID=A0AAD5T3W8_9FUNG|nr:hypothetical protein HK100_009667 [Physocladia obscura]
MSPNSVFHRHKATVFVLPIGGGRVYHLRSPVNDNGAADSELADKILEAFKNDSDLPLSRRTFKAHQISKFLSQQFSFNVGHEYRYINNQNESTSFENSPIPVKIAFEHIQTAVPALNLNELLVLGYLKGQKMNFHTDDEKGLGASVISWSFGSSAEMWFRERNPQRKNEFRNDVCSDSNNDFDPTMLVKAPYFDAFESRHVQPITPPKSISDENQKYNMMETFYEDTDTDEDFEAALILQEMSKYSRSFNSDTESMEPSFHTLPPLSMLIQNVNKWKEDEEKQRHELERISQMQKQHFLWIKQEQDRKVQTNWHQPSPSIPGLQMIQPYNNDPLQHIPPENNTGCQASRPPAWKVESPPPARRGNSIKIPGPCKTAYTVKPPTLTEPSNLAPPLPKKRKRSAKLDSETAEHKVIKRVCLKILLKHGDLLIMDGRSVQKHYEHSIQSIEDVRFAITARRIGEP